MSLKSGATLDGMKISWGGYMFEVYDKSQTDWNDLPGVYIFAELSNDKQWWYAKYVGQTNSFKDRLAHHEKWHDAVRAGATHVHARVEFDTNQRIFIEQELIQLFKPFLNNDSK